MRASHLGWNLLGLTLPLAIAALAVPHLIGTLGRERFGLLALSWGLIGYAGALDLGIGRAVTHYLARLYGLAPSEQEIAHVVLATAARITLIVGGIAAAAIAIAAALGIGSMLNVSSVSYAEIEISIYLLAIALPMQAMSVTYKGVNEAFLNFRGISVLRIILGMSNFGVPLLVSLYTIRMPWIVGSLVMSRAIALYAYKVLAKQCLRRIPEKSPSLYSSLVARELLSFGGWFSISSVLNPAVSSADRLIIASMISAAAVSTYVIPYELVVQSLVLMGAVTTVAFPYMTQMRISDPLAVKFFFFKAAGICSAFMLLIALGYVLFGELLLRVWLGAELTSGVYEVMKILSLGLVPYTIGTLSTAMLHAYGKTNLTAKINIIEFPFFIMLIFYCAEKHGVIGAAYAWVIRISLDSIILLIFSLRCK